MHWAWFWLKAIQWVASQLDGCWPWGVSWGALPLPLAQPRKPRAMTAAARVPANHPDLLIVFLFMASSSYWWQMVHCWLLDRPWHLKQVVGSICASKRCTVR